MPCRVPDAYLASSDALSKSRCDMTFEIYLKLGAYLKFQQKEGILSSDPYPPHNGRTVAPEAILFESPCRAHPET